MNKILVVDDDVAIRMLYTDELMEEGYEVVAHDGAGDIMTAIRVESPDLVVLDIKLGPNSGPELLRNIRNAHDALPVILCTAYHELKLDLNDVAAVYYALKSSDMTDLKLKIRRAFGAMTNPAPDGAGEDLQRMRKERSKAALWGLSWDVGFSEPINLPLAERRHHETATSQLRNVAEGYQCDLPLERSGGGGIDDRRKHHPGAECEGVYALFDQSRDQ